MGRIKDITKITLSKIPLLNELFLAFYSKYKRIIKRRRHNHQEMMDFYSRFISPGDLVFDVGANYGNRTSIFLELGARVVAVEPQSECIESLKLTFRKNKHLTIVPKVLGPSIGEAELMIANANTISSLSKEWIESVKSSGRFSGYSWGKKKIVPMTTLDQLIDSYGVPSFIKIDVEGFEYEVIAGLSRPVNFISLEFTPEFIHSTYKCIQKLESLGDILFNHSMGESMKLASQKYVTAKEIKETLDGYNRMNDDLLFGDVYCQFINQKQSNKPK